VLVLAGLLSGEMPSYGQAAAGRRPSLRNYYEEGFFPFRQSKCLGFSMGEMHAMQILSWTKKEREGDLAQDLSQSDPFPVEFSINLHVFFLHFRKTFVL